VDFAPNDVELSIASDGHRLLRRVFITGIEATAWAEEERAWEGDDLSLAARIAAVAYGRDIESQRLMNAEDPA
jgi:hypothetical protein